MTSISGSHAKNSLNLSCATKNSAHRIQIAACLPPFGSQADFGIYSQTLPVYTTQLTPRLLRHTTQLLLPNQLLPLLNPQPTSQPTNFPTTSTNMVGSVLRTGASVLSAQSAFCPISPTCPVGDTCQYEYGAVSLIVDCATEFAGGDLQISRVRIFPLRKYLFVLTTTDPYACRLHRSLRFEQGLCSN
jgi:hypothetical protein